MELTISEKQAKALLKEVMLELLVNRVRSAYGIAT
jgi:hypothetical protein